MPWSIVVQKTYSNIIIITGVSTSIRGSPDGKLSSDDQISSPDEILTPTVVMRNMQRFFFNFRES